MRTQINDFILLNLVKAHIVAIFDKAIIAVDPKQFLESYLYPLAEEMFSDRRESIDCLLSWLFTAPVSRYSSSFVNAAFGTIMNMIT